MADQHEQRGLSRAFSAVSRILTGTHPGEVGSQHGPAGRTGIIGCGVYVDGQRQPGNYSYAEALQAARRTPHGFVWLGLHEPRSAELAKIAEAYGLHELPVEDALKSYQRPKLERYGDMVFAALRTTRYVEHTELTEHSEVVETGAVMLFIGEHYIITVRHGVGGELSSVRADLEAKPELLSQGPWAVAHAVCDRIVDSYVDCAAAVELDLDQL